MAQEKKSVLSKAKIKVLEKLKSAGYDSANKVRQLDARQMLKLGMAAEMQDIFDLQDAIKANHTELAWLMDGEDERPAGKEAKHDHDRRSENRGAEGYSFSS